MKPTKKSFGPKLAGLATTLVIELVFTIGLGGLLGYLIASGTLAVIAAGMNGNAYVIWMVENDYLPNNLVASAYYIATFFGVVVFTLYSAFARWVLVPVLNRIRRAITIRRYTRDIEEFIAEAQRQSDLNTAQQASQPRFDFVYPPTVPQSVRGSKFNKNNNDKKPAA